MRYLTVMPDYTGSCIWDDFEGNLALDRLQLPNDFVDRLNSWHNLYKKIIPLSEEVRATMHLEIGRLDQEGLLLMQELKSCLAGDTKIRYYSEGKGMFLENNE
jgi:hypothetical protein